MKQKHVSFKNQYPICNIKRLLKIDINILCIYLNVYLIHFLKQLTIVFILCILKITLPNVIQDAEALHCLNYNQFEYNKIIYNQGEFGCFCSQ